MQQPGQVFVSTSVGSGIAWLSDQGRDEQGNTICILCTGKEGGTTTGPAVRVAVGLIGGLGQRYELVFMRVGENGDDQVYGNGEEVYLQSIMLQVTARIPEG